MHSNSLPIAWVFGVYQFSVKREATYHLSVIEVNLSSNPLLCKQSVSEWYYAPKLGCFFHFLQTNGLQGLCVLRGMVTDVMWQLGPQVGETWTSPHGWSYGCKSPWLYLGTDSDRSMVGHHQERNIQAQDSTSGWVVRNIINQCQLSLTRHGVVEIKLELTSPSDSHYCSDMANGLELQFMYSWLCWIGELYICEIVMCAPPLGLPSNHWVQTSI